MTAALADAWQDVLAAEQRAAFGYALLGPHLPDALQDRARALQAEHATARDAAAASVAALRVTPQAPQGDYPQLYEGLRRPALLAAHLEDGCAAGWRYLFAVAAAGSAAGSAAATDATTRAGAQRELIACAIRATGWRLAAGSALPVTPFPGT